MMRSQSTPNPEVSSRQEQEGLECTTTRHDCCARVSSGRARLGALGQVGHPIAATELPMSSRCTVAVARCWCTDTGALARRARVSPMATAEEITKHHEPEPDEDPWVTGPPPVEPVVIVPYNDEWPERFHALDHSIRLALGDAAREVEHVGSTSVRGLAAKDVIDIDLTVADPSDETSYVPALEVIGYVLVVREPSWHQHRMLRLDQPRTNLHVFGPDCPETIRHKMFRDWLRAHPDDRDLYAEAKREAIPGGGTVMDYNARKQAVIREIYNRVFRSAGLI